MNRCTKAVIHRENLEFNINQIKKSLAPGVKLCVAVKADAYGHNAVLTSRIAEKAGAEFLAIATVEEGVELRNNGIRAGLLLLSPCVPEEFPDLFKYQLTPFVFSEEYIRLLSDAADAYFKGDEKFPVHLAVDTGMGRIGCYPEEAGSQALLIDSSAHLALGGMATHFAVSDSISEENREFTREQYRSFVRAVQNVRACSVEPGICSCAASAVILSEPEMHFDMVRAGIITYGYYPDEITEKYLKKNHKGFEVKPVLSLETKVTAIRHFPKGKSVSYGRTWTAPKDTDIAVLPIGYADGLLRRYSPGLCVTINGRNYPVVGRICMDQCMVDIGRNNPNVRLWDKVLIFGPRECGVLNTADTLAEIGGTISYEVLTSITKRVHKEIS